MDGVYYTTTAKVLAWYDHPVWENMQPLQKIIMAKVWQPI
jgi:hypothetical protein